MECRTVGSGKTTYKVGLVKLRFEGSLSLSGFRKAFPYILVRIFITGFAECLGVSVTAAVAPDIKDPAFTAEQFTAAITFYNCFITAADFTGTLPNCIHTMPLCNCPGY